MKINLKSQLKKLSNRINLFSVLNEAVVNSIQAGGSKIIIELFRESSQDDFLDEKPKISSVHISDNGEGFNKKNRESFSEYGTENKISEGCKGIGRLSYLKVFDDVSIESYIENDSQKIYCKFTDSFQSSDFNIIDFPEVKSNTTKLKLGNIKPSYAKDHSIEDIRDKLFSHILPTLYLNNNHSTHIEIVDSYDGSKVTIQNSDLPNFQSLDFTVQENVTNDKQKINFTLHYAISDSKEDKVQDFYCANKRTVCRFKDKELRVLPIQGKNAIFLVTSIFFDNAANDERDDFDIYPKITNLLNPLSWDSINHQLKLALKKVIYEAFPDLEGKNRETISFIKNDNLHLVDYMQDIDSLGGLIDSEVLIEKAEQHFQQDKKALRLLLKGDEKNSADVLNRASDLAGKELIEYIVTRDKIITVLESLNVSQEKDEEIIRSHFLKRGIVGSDYSPVPVKENNLWLLDDKFMTYNYVASEKTLNTLLSSAGLPKSSSGDRFDIGIYSNSKSARRAILIEFKKLSANYKENGEGINQLSTYAATLSSQGIDELYLYLIAFIDQKFKDNLVNLYKFTKVFSQEGEIYHGTLNNVNAYIEILSPQAIIADARARNKTFIDMVRAVNFPETQE